MNSFYDNALERDPHDLDMWEDELDRWVPDRVEARQMAVHGRALDDESSPAFAAWRGGAVSAPESCSDARSKSSPSSGLPGGSSGSPGVPDERKDAA